MRQDRFKSCYVYGAQTTAYGIACALEVKGEFVRGYVVTSPEGNPSSIHGKQVFCLDELDPADHPRFYLAVPEYLHPEIIRNLENNGFRYFIPIKLAVYPYE